MNVAMKVTVIADSQEKSVNCSVGWLECMCAYQNEMYRSFPTCRQLIHECGYAMTLCTWPYKETKFNTMSCIMDCH